MADHRVTTMNLADNGEGMVPLNMNNNPTTTFHQKEAPAYGIQPEKNIIEQQETTMDSTPIDMLMEPPSMTHEPKMQGALPHMTAPDPQGSYAVQAEKPASKNPFNLTDDQLTALVAGFCAAISVSKPIQDRLATSVPKFLNEQGGRSLVGLASTGAVAAVIFFLIKDYVVKN
jgi:hypothetical protein